MQPVAPDLPATARARRYQAPIASGYDVPPLLAWLYQLVRAGQVSDFAHCVACLGGELHLVLEVFGARPATAMLFELLFGAPFRPVLFARLRWQPMTTADLAAELQGVPVPELLTGLQALGLATQDAAGRWHVRDLAPGGEA